MGGENEWLGQQKRLNLEQSKTGTLIAEGR